DRGQAERHDPPPKPTPTRATSPTDECLPHHASPTAAAPTPPTRAAHAPRDQPLGNTAPPRRGTRQDPAPKAPRTASTPPERPGQAPTAVSPAPLSTRDFLLARAGMGIGWGR